MNYPAASYGVSRTCPPLPRMLAFKLVAVPGDLPAIAVCAGIAVVRRPWRGAGRRVAGGSDFYNLNEASFGEFNPITHENLCLPYEMHFLFLFHRGNLRNLWIKLAASGGTL